LKIIDLCTFIDDAIKMINDVDEFIALIIYRDNELNALILKFVVKANNLDRVIDLWLKLCELNPFSNVFISFEPFDGVKSLAGCISWITQEKISVFDYFDFS